jgi:hypothetical protein
VNLHDWVDELCDALDIDLDLDEALVLDLSKVVATNVVRPAVPITAYLVGVAVGAAGRNPETAEEFHARAQLLAEKWERPADAPDPDDVDDDVPDDTGVDHSGEVYEA